jgi:NAD(P)-dependent dehydrogenase (short-subunit alcohol dehydrogenase family)
MNTSDKPVALVSGASRGIGKAIALRLLQENYTVVGLYKKSTDAATTLREQGIDMLQAGVGVEPDIARVLQHIKQAYGRLDVVVNNAAIDIFGKIESYNRMLATDLTSVFLLSKSSIPLLKNRATPILLTSRHV